MPLNHRDCGGTNDHWQLDNSGKMKDQAGSGNFCLSLVNGIGPAVEMADCGTASMWELWWCLLRGAIISSMPFDLNLFRVCS